jgi:hypothetical protein
MHVFSPATLAKDEANYWTSVKMLEENGIAVQYAEDPEENELSAAQSYFDRLFGEHLFRIVPASASFRNYPNSSRRTADGAAVELCVAREDGLAPYLWSEKATEWDKLGMPDSDDGLLRRAGLAADLIRDVVANCSDISTSRNIPDDSRWGGPGRLLEDLALLSTGLSGRNISQVPPYPTPARVAVEVALGDLLPEGSNAGVDSLPIAEGARAVLANISHEARDDSIAQELVHAAEGIAWMTPSGIAAWYDAVPERIREEAGISDFRRPPVEPIGRAYVEESDAPIAPQTLPVSYVSGDLDPIVMSPIFPDLDEIAADTRVSVTRLQRQVSDKMGSAENIDSEIRALQSQLEQKQGQASVAHDAIRALEEEVDGVIEADRLRRARALFQSLCGARLTLATAAQQWEATRAQRVSRVAELTPEREQLVQLVTSYEESNRAGALRSLDPTLRALLDEQAKRARESLGGPWTGVGGTATNSQTIIPVALSLSASNGLIRVIAALPLDGLTPEAFPSDGPDTALAAVTLNQMGTVLEELASPDGDRDVDAVAVQGEVTIVSFEANYRGTDSDGLADEEGYYALLCEEAAARHETLREAAVTVRFKAVPPDLLDDLVLVTFGEANHA